MKLKIHSELIKGKSVLHLSLTCVTWWKSYANTQKGMIKYSVGFDGAVGVKCIYCRFIQYTGILLLFFMYALYVVWVFTEGIIYSHVLEGWDRSLCLQFPFLLSLSLSPTPSPTTTNCTSVYPQQSGVFQQHRATLRHIYISIRRGLTLFNSTRVRQSFTGCAIHDRHRIWTMNYAEQTQTSRVFLGQQWLDVKMHNALGDV